MAFNKIINGGALLNTFEKITSVKNTKKLLAFLAVFMLSGTNLLMAQTAAGAAPGQEEAPKVDWTGIAYYVLIFFLICLGVAIVGKILKIYDLTLKMQGKKGIKWNTVMAVICIVFLFVGLYGAYWSFTEQGSMTLPEVLAAGGASLFQRITAQQRVGNAGRNILRADGINNIDLGIFKNTRIGENQRLQLRAEFNNATNTRDFGIPEGRVNSSAFLNQWSTNGGNRRIVIGLRYIF